LVCREMEIRFWWESFLSISVVEWCLIWVGRLVSALSRRWMDD
jgi:hypothetical protein